MLKQRVPLEKDDHSSCGLSAYKIVNGRNEGKIYNSKIMDTNEIPRIPTQKERWAYAIEFSAKILYTIFFLIYIIVYWTSYYGV